MFYSLENRPNIKAQNPEFGVGKLAQRLAQHWKLMNTTQKHPYQLMARKDKERYESELKAYKKGMYTGTGLTARQVAHSVTGRTIPPPASQTNSSSSRPTSQTSQLPSLASPVNEEGSPPSGDELDQLCEFYQWWSLLFSSINPHAVESILVVSCVNKRQTVLSYYCCITHHSFNHLLYFIYYIWKSRFYYPFRL